MSQLFAVLDRLASKLAMCAIDMRHSLHFVALMQGVRPMDKNKNDAVCE